MNPAIPANSIDQFTASIVANLARASSRRRNCSAAPA